MKIRITKGTTLHGKPVDVGSIHDLDPATAMLLVRSKLAVQHTEPAPARVEPEAAPASAGETVAKKGKLK